MKTTIKKIIVKAGIFSIIALFVSCASETEQHALNAVEDVYGGNVSYTKGFNKNSGKTENFFNVKISESKMIDSLAVTVTTANIARIVYAGMTQEERDKYSKINVEMITTKKDTSSYTYPMNVAKRISEKAKNYINFSNYLVNGEWSKLDEIKNPEDIKANLSTGLAAKIKEMEKLHGSIKSHSTFGVAEIKDNIGAAFQYQGYLQFANGKNAPYIVMIDLTEGKDKVIGFRIF